MKKLLTAAVIVLVSMAACNNGDTTEANKTDSTTRAKEISDSTTMLDKKLADSTSTYTPDSLNK